MSKNKSAMLLAVLAAALYAINVPLSKLLMESVMPAMLAGLLYIGAGVGMAVLLGAKKLTGRLNVDNWLGKEDMPYAIAMVLLDVAAPILLMLGIANTSAASVSLLNNFEIVATSVIALLIFKEKISGRLWWAIILVVVSGIVLSFEGMDSLEFNKGSLYVLCACACWGIENNCTRSISGKSSEQIVVVKGLGSGIGGLITATVLGESFPQAKYILLTMLLGFIAYGLSIDFYIMAQNTLGAAKTSAFYSIAPFLGVGFSFVLLKETPDIRFYAALAIMAISTAIMIKDTLGSEKPYGGYVHTHQHAHGGIVHTHEHRHATFNPMHLHLHIHKAEE